MRKDSQPAELDSASVCKNVTLRFVSHLYGSYSDMMGRGGGGRRAPSCGAVISIFLCVQSKEARGKECGGAHYCWCRLQIGF